jgi:hypothetical protein
MMSSRGGTVSDSRDGSKIFPLTTGQIFSLKRPDLYALVTYENKLVSYNLPVLCVRGSAFSKSEYRTLKTTSLLVTGVAGEIGGAYNSHVRVLAEGEIFLIRVEHLERYFDDSDRLLG